MPRLLSFASGLIFLVILLVLPFFLPFSIFGVYAKVISILLWAFLILSTVVVFFVPKKYKDKILENIKSIFEKIIESIG